MLKKASIFFYGFLCLVGCLHHGRAGDLFEVMKKARQATVSVLTKSTSKKDKENRAAFFGTGFLVSPDGHVVTSAHNLSRGEETYVQRFNQQQEKAEVIGIDPLTDLAVLKIKASTPTPFLTWEQSAAYLGQSIFIIGTPFGLEGSVSRGIVSHPNRALTNSDIGLNSAHQISGFIQTDAAMSLGHSGGPMLSVQGKVMGVNAAIVSPTEGSIGLGFSIPSRLAKFIVEQLMQEGSVQRLSLGIELQTPTKNIARYFDLDQPSGALISSLDELGQGFLNGLNAGDLILEINGERVNSADNVPEILTLNALKPEVTFTVLRQGKEKQISFAITPDMLMKPNEMEDAPTDQEKDALLKVAELTPLDRVKYDIPEKINGVLVQHVPSQFEKDIFPNSVLESIDGESALDSDSVRKRLTEISQSGKPALLHLWLDGKRYFSTYP